MKTLFAVFAISIGLHAGAACAAELGRLFYTPMQRTDMDRKRLSNPADIDAGQAASAQLTINGRITSSSGRSTTWVNGVPDYDPQHRPASQRSAKIGQTVDVNTGAISDPLEGGSIVVKPAR
jgi:hypothetical protein